MAKVRAGAWASIELARVWRSDIRRFYSDSPAARTKSER
jgi:hypothetical protein